MTVVLADKPWKAAGNRALLATYQEWNDDPLGGSWTGYDDILAQIDAGHRMAAGVCILPVTRWQHDRYRWFQNECIARGGERRPPAQHGPAAIHVHIEVAARAEVSW